MFVFLFYLETTRIFSATISLIKNLNSEEYMYETEDILNTTILAKPSQYTHTFEKHFELSSDRGSE